MFRILARPLCRLLFHSAYHACYLYAAVCAFTKLVASDTFSCSHYWSELVTLSLLNSAVNCGGNGELNLPPPVQSFAAQTSRNRAFAFILTGKVIKMKLVHPMFMCHCDVFRLLKHYTVLIYDSILFLL